MDVRLDAGQEMFGRVAGKLAAEITARWEPGRSRAESAPPAPTDSDWQRISDAGWFAIRLDEEAGGSGGSCVDVCVVAEQLGYHALPTPVLGTMLVLEQLRLAGADLELQSAIAAGEYRLAPVLNSDLTGFATTANDAGTVLAVDAAGAKAAAIVSEEIRQYPITSRWIGADLTREFGQVNTSEPIDAHVANLTPDSAALATAFALTVVAADLLGVSARALDAAVEHAKARKQFGVAIGSFQAIQHMAAECLVSVEAIRSAVWYAAWAVDELPAAQALRTARTAKAFASTEVVTVTETAVQILGGLGMTWESMAHVWQRRAQLDRCLFGNEDYQYDRLAEA